jgi:hypothetical protein
LHEAKSTGSEQKPDLDARTVAALARARNSPPKASGFFFA